MINHGLEANEQDSVWIGVQVAITGAGNITKALWGQSRKISPSRKMLRQSLLVSENSSLRQVGMRNNFEHFDERLDEWWEKSAQHNFLDRMIGPPSAVVGINDLDRFRVYDNTTHDVVFWGERFNIQAIATEVGRLLPIAEAESAKPHWET